MHNDVIVIGCGATGLSIAYNLAANGLRVLAIDRVGPGQQTSAKAAGVSVIAQTDPAMGDLMHRSIDTVANFQSKSGVSLPFHRNGSIKYALSDWSAAQLGREVERARKLGAQLEIVTCKEAEKLAPHTNATEAISASYSPNDIYFSPPDLLRSYFEAAKRVGVSFKFGSNVVSFSACADRVISVNTEVESFGADQVVLSAGPWTSDLLSQTGIPRLPLVAIRHQCSIRSGIPGINPMSPTVRVVDFATYSRPEGSNLLFGTYEPKPMVFEDIPERTEQTPLDECALNEVIAKVQHIYRGLSSSFAISLQGGTPTITPDGSYLIDQAPLLRNMYFITGCNVMGLSVAPALGEEIATWLSKGERSPTLSAFSLDRFAQRSKGDVRSQSLAEYEAIYRDEHSANNIRNYGEPVS